MADHNLREVAFPALSCAQIQKVEACAEASTTKFKAGDTLFRVGDRDFKFFIIKSGEVEIVDESSEPRRTIAIHKTGSFTGDVSHLTGRPAVVSAIVKSDCEVIEITNENLKQVMNRCPELSDLVLQAFIARRQLMREPGNVVGLRVVGSRYSKDTFRIRDFLSKNRVMFTWIDLEDDPDVDVLLKQFGLTEADTPVVACGQMMIHRNPSNRELAEHAGLRQTFADEVYDLVVVGAGPAGLAAAVYGASEGLSTVLLERSAPGGQAGNSMRIENYLGFPMGITGSELADRAVLQASKFGANLSITSPVESLSFDNAFHVISLGGDEKIVAKCLLIASGAEYQKLDVEGCTDFEGCGVYYAATPNESSVCKDAEVIVVGGGNSAGQAAVFLAGHANKVHVLIRGDNLYKNMSSYLATRLEQTSKIQIHYNTEIQCMKGNGHLAKVEVRDVKTKEVSTIETPALFSFIGAVPRTNWLPPEIEVDARGFVKTGPGLAESPHWTAKRHPFLLETSRPGIFAAGDVRSGSVKRVASAVGEGSMSVQFVHEYLKDM